MARALAPYRETPWPDQILLPCEHCGRWRPMELHHRKYRSRGGGWNPANIIGLCPTCHSRVTTDHTGYSDVTGLAIPSFGEPLATPVVVWHERTRVLFDDIGGFTVSDIPC